MRIKILQSILAVVMIAGLAGCATPVSSTISTTSAGKARQPKKIFVVLSAPDKWDEFVDSFEQTFSQSIEDCGGNVTLLSIPVRSPDLSLNDDAAINKKHVEDGVKAYKPDAVLTVIEKPIQTCNRSHCAIGYAIQMVDPITHQKLMFGTANVTSTVMANHGDVFADNLVNSMKNTGLLSFCPVGPREEK